MNLCLAAKLIEEVPKSLVITSHPMEEPWQIKYLTSEAGKQFMECQQEEQQCLISCEDAEKEIVDEPKFEQMVRFVNIQF